MRGGVEGMDENEIRSNLGDTLILLLIREYNKLLFYNCVFLELFHLYVIVLFMWTWFSLTWCCMIAIEPLAQVQR
jgi:hypothetical protein